MNITCDNCQAIFMPEVKDRPLRGGGKERRFRCPHCHQVYIVAIFTLAGVRISQEIQQVEATIKQQPSEPNTILRERLSVLRDQLRTEVRGPHE